MSGRILELRVHGVSNTPPADILGMDDDAGVEPAPPRLVAGDAMTGFYRAADDDSADAGSAKPEVANPEATTFEAAGPTGAGPRPLRADPAGTRSGADSADGTHGEPVTVEAYSWGQLTSGARTARDIERALWTALLPFTLANIALHARPEVPADPERERWTSRSGIAAWLIRLFCLSLTATMVLAATGVGVDLVGWQCADPRCLAQVPGPWGFLGDGWWSDAARPLAVGLLLPFGLVALIGLLTWRTYQYEAELPAAPDDPADQEPPDNPLRHPTFWCGEGQVRRLAVVHLCAGGAAAAVVPLGAVLVMDPPAGPRAVLAWGAAGTLVAAVALAAAALGHPYLARRGGPAPLGRYATLLVWLSLAGIAGTVTVLLLPDGPRGTPLADLRPPLGCLAEATRPGCGADRSLPGYDGLIGWLAGLQVLLLIAIGGVSRTGRRALAGPLFGVLALVVVTYWYAGGLPGVPDPPQPLPAWAATAGVFAATAAATLLLPRRPAIGPGTARDHRMAWGGCGPAVLAGLGWLLGSAYSAGALHWTTARLNRDMAETGVAAVLAPVPTMWAGPAVVTAGLALLGTAARVWVEFATLRRHSLAGIITAGRTLSAHDRRRARDVAAFHALHRLVGERALRFVGQFTAVAGGLAAVATAAALTGLRPTPESPRYWAILVRGAVDSGAALAGLLPVLVATVGLLVYRHDSVRRAVGVVWDIGTFWPRTAHPLAPPSYAERAVPQVQTRATNLMALPADDPRRADAIILSGHSQGAVILAAVILQIPARWRHRIWFLSYGCQLSRLYGRVFPAYFGPDRLPAVTTALTGPDGLTRWTNFWRPTDPLGWPVPAGEREVVVRDPEALHPRDGEVRDPPIRSHGGYPHSVEYQRERAEAIAVLGALGPVAAPSTPPDARPGGPAPGPPRKPIMDTLRCEATEGVHDPGTEPPSVDGPPRPGAPAQG